MVFCLFVCFDRMIVLISIVGFYREDMSKADQINKFWNEADFGYVKNIKDSIYPICQSEKEVRQMNPYLCCCIGYWLFNHQIIYCSLQLCKQKWLSDAGSNLIFGSVLVLNIGENLSDFAFCLQAKGPNTWNTISVAISQAVRRN